MSSRGTLASPSPVGLACCVASLRSKTQVINSGKTCFPNSYPQHRKLPHTAFGPSSSWGEKHWKHKRGKVPGVRKQVRLPGVPHPSCHTPEHSCTASAQEGIKSAQVALMCRALTGKRHLIRCVACPGAVQYHELRHPSIPPKGYKKISGCI